MNVTIDSSIFVDAVSENSVNYQLCLDLLKQIYNSKNITIYQPTLFLFEFVSAAIRQETGKQDKKIKRMKYVQKICTFLINNKNTHFDDVTLPIWHKWCKNKHLSEIHKSQDEIFMLTAINNNAILLTLDQEMINKPNCFAGKCKIYSPYEGLKLIQNKTQK